MIKLCKIKNVALRRSAVIIFLLIAFFIYLIGATAIIVATVIIHSTLTVCSVLSALIQAPKDCCLDCKSSIIEYISLVKPPIDNSKKMMKSDFKPCNKTDEQQ